MSPDTTNYTTVRVDSQGRILIPAEQRRALGLNPGDRLAMHVKDGELHAMTVDASIRRAQAIVRRYVPEGVSLVDELIAERRAETERENRELFGD